MRILFFGDSITQGFWDSEGGWVQRIRKQYDNQQLKHMQNLNQPAVFNLGTSGDTTTGILNRFDGEVGARKWRWPNEDFAFVFATGVNDSGEDNYQKPDPEVYGNELNELIIKAKNHTNRILFVGLTLVEESGANNRPGKTKEYSNERIKQFNEVLKACCTAKNIDFVEIIEEFNKKIINGENLFADGLHPNNAGHELIASLVKPELDKLLVS